MSYNMLATLFTPTPVPLSHHFHTLSFVCSCARCHRFHFRRKASPSRILYFPSLWMLSGWGQKLTPPECVLVKCIIYKNHPPTHQPHSPSTRTTTTTPPPHTPMDTRGKGGVVVTASAMKGCICDAYVYGWLGWWG